MSDHRPVSATFSVPVRAIDSDAFHNEAAALFSKLGKLEDSEEVPKLKIGTPEVDFGQIWYVRAGAESLTGLFGVMVLILCWRFKKRCSQKLRIENIGKVAAAFRFIPLNEEDAICRSPLAIQ